MLNVTPNKSPKLNKTSRFLHSVSQISMLPSSANASAVLEDLAQDKTGETLIKTDSAR
jgi:hypothetical protein